ncbi:MAG: hypothetical protein NT013_06320 [Planctomycetia bacterium]|nr:hypothetical protein [Planctomycetia bacterium]
MCGRFDGEQLTSTAGTFQNALPDFIGRLRLQRESVQFPLAAFVNKASFIPTVGTNSDATAWGLSMSSSLQVAESDKLIVQAAFGHGIQRFRGFQSYTLDASGSLIAVPALACYFGYEHAWSPNLKSVLAYSRATIDNPAAAPTSAKSTSYLAANILWTPVERVRLGLEYLHGVRVDDNAIRGDASCVGHGNRYLDFSTTRSLSFCTGRLLALRIVANRSTYFG